MTADLVSRTRPAAPRSREPRRPNGQNAQLRGHWAYVLDGAVNGELFVAYIEQQVVPNLACGDVLIMDNLPFHKSAGVRHALEAVGITLLFLPAYSPDLNPIEMVFAKTKALLRKAATRTVDALWRALGRISQTLTRKECANYFQHCGYVRSG